MISTTITLVHWIKSVQIILFSYSPILACSVSSLSLGLAAASHRAISSAYFVASGSLPNRVTQICVTKSLAQIQANWAGGQGLGSGLSAGSRLYPLPRPASPQAHPRPIPPSLPLPPHAGQTQFAFPPLTSGLHRTA